MLRWPALPFSRPCSSCSDPMPMRSPAGPMTAVPPQLGWDGAVKIASSSTYSQYPANSCLATIRAATERCRPPAPATTTRSPIAAAAELPMGRPAGPAGPAPAPGRSRFPGHRPRRGPAPARPSIGVEPDGFGLGDEIADGQDQPVCADHDAVAGAFGAERPGGEGVLGHRRANPTPRRAAVEIEVVILGLGPRLRRHFPVAQARHRRKSFFADGDEIIREGPFKSWCRAPVGGAQWTGCWDQSRSRQSASDRTNAILGYVNTSVGAR